MPIRASAVGQELAEREVEITARQLLSYAAGVGETSDIHFDDARPGGCLAVPAFCVSLEWPVVRASASDNPFGASAAEILRGVHASQDSTFHRSIRAGDRLRVAGRIASIRATRAGALVVTRLATTDASTGEPVITSWYGSIFRGVEVSETEGVVTRAEAPAALPSFQTGETGELGGLHASAAKSTHTRVSIPIAREAPHLYTECADIWNPIHTERQVALSAGLPDIILHGTATWALAAREIVRHRCDGDPLRLQRLYGRFAAMVIPGTTIEVEIGVPAPGAGDGTAAIPFEVRNAAGELALAQGVAQLG